jgi:hypothetical protein
MSSDNVIVIHPDGRYEPVECKGKLSLEKAQELVGGYVEIVPMFDKFSGVSCVVLCDEEGKLKHKPINNRATLEWYKCASLGGDMLVGDVVVVMGPARKGWR